MTTSRADLELRISHEGLDIKVNDDCGFRLFVVDDAAALRVKKVDRQSKPSNIRTEQQSKVELQLELPGVTKATIVTLGYHLNELWNKVLWVKLICRLDGRLLWTIPVSQVRASSDAVQGSACIGPTTTESAGPRGANERRRK